MIRKRKKKKCGDCAVEPGEYHKPGCDVERCMKCGGQLIGCQCLVELVYDPENEDAEPEEREKPWPADEDRERWSGIWPGIEKCQEFGWYAKMIPGKMGWHQCDVDDPDGSEDLNRLAKCPWNSKTRRFELAEMDIPDLDAIDPRWAEISRDSLTQWIKDQTDADHE